MTYFNEKYINKSYVLDFRQNGTTEDLIVFSLPPQTENYTYPQRISETKTFGGVVFEDYGNDSVKISITGTTVNNEMRLIYKKNTATADAVTGDEEINYIRDLIRNYGKKNKLKNKTVYLYINGEDSSNSFWQVLIQNFEIKRSKDNPLSYNYQFEFLGINDEVVGAAKFKEAIKSVKEAKDTLKKTVDTIESVESKIDSIDAFLDDKTTKALEAAQEISSEIEEVGKKIRWGDKFLEHYENIKSNIRQFESDCYATSNMILNSIKDTVDYPIQIIKETESVIDELTTACVRIPTNITLKMWNDALVLCNEVEEVVDWGRNFISGNSAAAIIAVNSVDTITESVDDVVDSISRILGKMSDNSHKIIANMKSEDEETVVNPGNSTDDDELIRVYGYKEYNVLDGDTWDVIAYKFYNDASYAKILASYNYDLGSLKAGLKIYIPIFSKQEGVINDSVYNVPGTKDNFGVDIKLSSNGAIEFENGDFKKISGQDNLDQSIQNRLSAEVENSIRKVAYGIKSSVGSSYIPSGYILASIKQTLLMDNRIRSVDSISYRGENDRLNIKIVYTTINDSQKKFEGVL